MSYPTLQREEGTWMAKLARREIPCNSNSGLPSVPVWVRVDFSTLSPDIKMHILLTVLNTFLMELVRKICLNIKTSYP